MLIVRDSQVKKLFYKEQEIDKILDWNGNVVFEKESAPVMTNTIKFHTTSDVTYENRFEINYTDSTRKFVYYKEPNKEYIVPIPTDKIVESIYIIPDYIDEVTVSCKIKLSSDFFNNKASTTIRLLSCDATASEYLSNSFQHMPINSKLVEIRNLDARNATNMNTLFGSNPIVESIVMRNLNVSKVTSMYRMFSKCSGATTIDIADWDTSSVTDLYGAFSGCTSVTALDLSSWNTSNVTRMNWMFENCSSLQSLDLSNFNTSNVTNMRCMFDYCSSLTSLTLSSFDTSKVTDMMSMFYGCSELTSLNLSSFNTNSVTNTSFMFGYCEKLTELDLSGFDMTNVYYKNTEYMFKNCKALKTIYMRGCNQKTIDKIKSALSSADILNNVTIITGDVPTTNYIKFTTSPSVASSNVFTVTYTDSTQDTLSYSEPSKEYSLSIPTDKIVNKIDFDNAMIDEVKVSCKIYLSNTFFTNKPKTIRILNCDATSSTSMNMLFSGVKNIETIEIKDSDFSNVTDMFGMFYTCGGAITIDIANCNTSKVTNMNSMFYDCTNLASLDLSGCDMTNVTNTSDMFKYCDKLTTIRMIGCNQTTIDKIKKALTSAGILNKVTIVT